MLNINKIKKLHRNSMIKKKVFCEEIGISEITLDRNYKSRKFSVPQIEKVAEILGVPISYLFDEEDKAVNFVNEPTVAYKNGSLEKFKEEIKRLEIIIEEKEGQLEYFRKLYEKILQEKTEIIAMLRVESSESANFLKAVVKNPEYMNEIEELLSKIPTEVSEKVSEHKK